jgi:hypothetical protein
MYEIIADPKDYKLGALKEGLGHTPIHFPDDDRKKWAEEIGSFAERLDGLSVSAKDLKTLFVSDVPIVATPASLKTFKIQLFKINDALNIAIDLAGKIGAEIVKK